MVQERHSIAIPGSILDEIRDKESKGDYGSDKRYREPAKKRKSAGRSRKDRRKEERTLKKAKKSPKHNADFRNNGADGKAQSNAAVKKQGGKAPSEALEIDLNESDDEVDDDVEEEEEASDLNEEDTWNALKALKGKKSESPIKMVSEDSLEDEFGGFSDEGVEELDYEEEDDEENNGSNDQPSTVEETMAALKALKAKKLNNSSSKPEKRKKDISAKVKETKVPKIKTTAMRDDEAQMAYYAKKLGISKNSKLQNNGDGLDSLLDGLDFDFGSGPEDEDEQSDGQEETNFDDADELSDLSEEEGLESSQDDDDDSLISDSDAEETSREKENPYKAPETGEARYVPPALRRKMLESADEDKDSEEVRKIRKSLIASLNKLTEGNFITIVKNELNQLYQNNARQTVTECLTEHLLNSIKSPSRLLDSSVIVYTGVVSSLYKLQGIEFAAYFIQQLVESLEELLNDSSKQEGKEVTNLISFFGFAYNFSVYSSNLIFDIIKVLCEEISEVKIEALLRLVLISGQKMRADDPSSLRDIITLASKSIEKQNSLRQNTRARFLLETLQNVRNNKFRSSDQTANNDKIMTSLKKQQQNLSKVTSNPIQVTLDDIHSIDTKGKWWLVGSAWKGKDARKERKDFEVNEEAMNDIIDAGAPNWGELADFCRMNTSIRRAIFIAIMSSEDFEEAVRKISKLGLRGSQKFEVPKILIICCSVEPHYNAFYGFVAKELCKDHDMRKTFQFNFWDLIKDFEGSENYDSDEDDQLDFRRLTDSSSANGNDDEESKLKKILSLGKLYGYLIGQGSLPLLILKTVNFLTAAEDTKLFVERLLVTFLDNVATLSELPAFGGSKKKSKDDVRFDDKKLIEKIPKGQPVLLKGLRYFLEKRVSKSNFCIGKKQKRRVTWGCEVLCDSLEEFLLATGDD